MPPLGLELLFYAVVALGVWVLWPQSYPSVEDETEFLHEFIVSVSEREAEPKPECSHCGDCGYLPPYCMDWDLPCVHCNVYQEILLRENPPEPVRRREAIEATKKKHGGNKAWRWARS